MEKVLAVILAGGQGERLSVLALERAKPAVPFAGKYRIIDFTLSNCANSGVRHVLVLTQYHPYSLGEHIGIGVPWGFLPPDKSIRMLQPYLTRDRGHEWYRGTADAVYQNLGRIEETGAELVLVLSGDHVYKMNYASMIKFHKESQADITLAVTPYAEEALQQFGTVVVDDGGRVVRFHEKVKNPPSNLVSMGIYLFNQQVLREWLTPDSGYDFGRHLFPRLLKKLKIMAYVFQDYWRDVGTVQAYWQANMEVRDMARTFLAKRSWPIRTVVADVPPSVFSDNARVSNSLVSDGCIVAGQVEHSVLSPGVRVAGGAVVRNSVVLNDTVIGRDSIIDYAILDKGVMVGAGCHIGYGDDYQVNRKEPRILNTGITVVGKKARVTSGIKIGRNCLISSNVVRSNFTSTFVPSGETILPKRTEPRR